eukprot:gene15310-20632_t
MEEEVTKELWDGGSISPEEIAMVSVSDHKPTLKTSNKTWQKRVLKAYNTVYPQLALGFLLMVSLFMSESWTLGNAPTSSDNVVDYTLVIVFCIFCLEITVLAVLQDGYLFSFFFALDIIGTLSILLDVSWITSLFLPDGALRGQGSVIRATRTAKLGARYGRLLRLMKVLKFVNTLPCFSLFSSKEDEYEPTLTAIKRVSNELSSVLSMRVALLVLIIVIVVPFLSYAYTDYSPGAWLNTMKIMAKNENTTSADLTNLIRKIHNFYAPKDTWANYVYIESPYLSDSPFERTFKTREVLRDDNILLYDSSYQISGKTYSVKLNIDSTVPNQFNALYGILVIVLVIIVLFSFTASFNESVKTLVVKPLEKMMITLRNSAMALLESMKAISNTKEKDEEKSERNKDGYSGVPDEDDEDEDMEAAMLEKMVDKLARIVKHVLPSQTNVIVADDNTIDKTTATWLNQSYSTGVAQVVFEHAGPLDEAAEKARMNQLELTLKLVSKERLNSWEFDVLEYTNDELCEITVYIFASLHLLDDFRIPMPTFQNFLREISNRYINTNTYHNFKHGCDVMHTSYRLLTVPALNTIFSSLEVLSLIVGAIAHDVGHLGVNNVFLVKAKHELAILHNDRSPLENMHCVVLYDIVNKAATNIFMNLTDPQWRDCRKSILNIILGTDMSHHFEQISKTQLFFEVNGEDTGGFCSGVKDEIECFKEDKNRSFIMELILHVSDISNPYKPFNICAKWADLVVEEFCTQGDREKKEGLEVSPMCDRDTLNLCNMQMGFIEFVVAPLVIAFVNIFPPLHAIGTNMADNYASWGDLRKVDIRKDEKISDKTEECRKVDERIVKFREKLSFVNSLRERAVRRKSLELMGNQAGIDQVYNSNRDVNGVNPISRKMN